MATFKIYLPSECSQSRYIADIFQKDISISDPDILPTAPKNAFGIGASRFYQQNSQSLKGKVILDQDFVAASFESRHLLKPSGFTNRI